MVISLSAKGLTTGEIPAHLAEVYGAEVSRQTISTITDKVMEGMAEWQNRPLDPVYPVVFIDADPREDPRRAGRQPADLRRPGGHRRRHPRHPRAVGRRRRRGRQVLAARAHRDQEPGRRATCCMVVCDGLKGLPDAIDDRVAADDRPDLHRPPAAQQLPLRRPRRTGTRSPRPSSRSTPPRPRPPPWNGSPSSPRPGASKYPAIVRLWENAWAEFVPFLAFDTEIRKVICSTNAIESVNARIRRAVQGPRALPQRAGRAQVRLPGGHEPGPDRHGPQTLDPSAGRPH